ncbi:MAG: hypothetical protein V4692_16215 [Bdellovibrionota bacterium]
MRVLSILTFILAFESALAVDLRPLATEPVSTGIFEVVSAEYKLPAKVDPDVLAGVSTELWAKAFWPKTLKPNRPILFFLHGNHATCGTNTVPRSDWDCTYSQTGVCPEGTSVIQNHAGFDYLGKHFASLGYVAVSINANRGINCSAGNDDDEGLILARGRLVLKHIETWRKWSSGKLVTPKSLGLKAGALKGKIDFNQVGLMGHSRGGEGMRAAYNLYREKGSAWPRKVPELSVKGIFEIASVDGQSTRVLNAEDTAWSALLPMCDGDVTDFSGKMPFDRMLSYEAETRKSPKSINMVWGANHNFFNTEWLESDSFGCMNHDALPATVSASKPQQDVAFKLMTAFFKGHVGNERVLEQAQTLDPAWSIAPGVLGITRVDSDHTYSLGNRSVVVAEESNGVVLEDIASTPAFKSVAWEQPGNDHFLQLKFVSDLSKFEFLDLRLSKHEDEAFGSVDFSVALVLQDNSVTKSIPISEAGDLSGPVTTKELFQTVRIPLSRFEAATPIRAIKLIFDKTAKARIRLSDVRLSSSEITLGEVKLPELMPVFQDSIPLPEDELSAIDSLAFGGEPVAHIETVQHIAKSSMLRNRPGLDITITSKKRFPVGAALPVLVIAGEKFGVSRFAGTHKIVFTVSSADFAKLPDAGSMHVQYGRKRPTKIWSMPGFDRQQWNQESR